MRRLFLSCILICATAAQADDRYLIPTFVTVPGAHGSYFVSELSLMAVGTAIDIRGLTAQCPGLCPPPRPATFRLEPGPTHQGFSATGKPGLVVKAPSGADLQMRLRVRDTSRDQLSAGTEIPVVHESRMKAAPLRLLSIPPEGPRFRNRLRVYAFEPVLVRLSFVRESDYVTLYQTTMMLAKPGDVPAEDLEFYPAYAEFSEFPPSDYRLRVDVEPLTSSTKIWAFVTTTNNMSQEITIATPNP